MRYLTFILFLFLFEVSSLAQSTLRLEDLDITKVRQRSGNPRRIIPESGDSLRIGGVRFNHGLGTVAASIFEIDLLGNVSRFHAVCGVGNEAKGKGEVEFEVFADGNQIWTSGKMDRNSPNKKVDLDLSGVQRIVLYVAEEGNWDELPVYWADPEFTISGNANKVQAFIEKAEISTPQVGPEPKINGARVFGIRPNSPFMFTIPSTGNRPMEFSAAAISVSSNGSTTPMAASMAARST